MASDRSIIQPVFGMPRRKPSSDILDSAESLVENLDSLADILDRLAEKYEIESKYQLPGGSTDDGDEELVKTKSSDHSLFSKLKTGLDSAKLLISCLRREKGRLKKRQVSVECRMGEIEDYKQHMKQDLTSLNEMVDLLSLRVVQLETKLVEEQEAYENLEAEKNELEDRLKGLQIQDEDTPDSDNNTIQGKGTDVIAPKSNFTLALENKELQYKVEILVVENRKLKDMVRKQIPDESELENDLGTPRMSESEYSEDGNNNNNNNKEQPVFVSDESDF